MHIQQEFQHALHDSRHTLAGFQVGIGVAHGRAIAGKIGTKEQIKVGAFGPTVNLGARLKDLPKHSAVSILVDEATADFVRKELPPSEGRLRRIGRFRPAGMNTELMLSQLLPSVELDPSVTDEAIKTYETAWDLFAVGEWRDAFDQLNLLPDRTKSKDYLMLYITQHNGKPPTNWNGVIVMQTK